MAEKTFQFEVVSPSRVLVQEEVEFVLAPGAEGDFGVLVGHCPFITTLKIGPLVFRKNGTEQYMTVMGGFAEVTPTKMVVLAELAEKTEELDIERARKAQQESEKKRASAVTESEREEAQKSLDRSLVRQAVASKSQK
ncbi:MAG TPA: F0F1 ATP synthase subunit epsilon [Nitrospiria bacterium]|jgi:F-type H+-transporting ATPase subunit epsilon